MLIDTAINNDNWSDLRQFKALPNINFSRLYHYRLARMQAELQKSGAAVCMGRLCVLYIAL